MAVIEEINVNSKETIILADTMLNEDGHITVVCPRCKKFRKVVKNAAKDAVLTEYCRNCGQHYSAFLDWGDNA